MSKNSPSAHMSVGRGRFRQALLLVLLDRHTSSIPDLHAQVVLELGGECIYCGLGGSNVRLQLDHLWPKTRGGQALLGNLVPACPTCNSDRRQQDWESFLRSSVRRSKAQVEEAIDRIRKYMARHEQDREPDLEQILTEEERTLRIDFELLLQAISDGSLAVAGYKKTKSVVFGSPAQLFEDLLAVVRRHHRGSAGASA